MPHGTPSHRRVNAKKKGRDHRATTTTTSRANNRSTPNTAPPPSRMNTANMDGRSKSPEEKKEGHVPPLQQIQDTLYVRYKRCTQRFKDTLQSMVPAEIFPSDTASALMTAAEYVAGNDAIPVPPQLLADLQIAIRVRKRVALDQFAGGDPGHSYFNSVLAYCWSILSPRSPRKMRGSKQTTTTKEASIRNRFDKLSVEEKEENELEENEADLEGDLPSSPMARPEEEAEFSRLSLEELISGSDRTSGILFVMTLDELMHCVSNHYSLLREASAWVQKEGHPPGIIVEQMMEAAVATNFAIQQVAFLEESFAQDYPHLNTVYRLLACLQLVDLVPILTRIVSKKSPRAAQFSEKDAVAFLGDAMECAFRNVSDPRKRHLSLVKEFLQRWQFSDDIPAPGKQQTASNMLSQEAIRQMYESSSEQYSITDEMSVQRIVEYLFMLVRIEVPLHQEQQVCHFRKFATSLGMSSHQWLKYLTFLGQDRSIVHTVRLLQALSNVIKGQKGVLLPLGTQIFGPRWNKRQVCATKTQLEMDSLLMEDIMPSMVNMCYEGLLSDSLPYHEELLAGFSQLKVFVKDPEPPVTWSLAFTVHSIFTSVLEVQGSNHPFFLFQTARLTYRLYFQQLVRAKSTHPNSISQRAPSWDDGVESLLLLEYIPVSMFSALPSHEIMAIWNPFCAGAFLSYVAYFCNLQKGVYYVDAAAQLRMTLHLFNALKQVQAIRSGQVEPLDLIFKVFKDCKAVWEGPLPTQGQFQKRWLITSGTQPGLAAQMQKGTAISARERNGESRTRTPILAEHLSASFRRICRRDFSDIGDSTRDSAKSEGSSSVIDVHAARVDGTWDAMQADEQLLGMNLIALGYYLNQFYLKFFHDFGLTSKVEQLIRQSTLPRRISDERLKYHVMSVAFAKYILGPLDKGDARVASKCTELLVGYFNGMSPENVMWFTPTTSEKVP